MRVISLIFLCLVAASAEPLSENQSRFGVIKGDVGLLSQGAIDWVEPHDGLPIEPGDHIRTGEDGRVELLMSENVLWTLVPGTEVVVEHTEVNAGKLDLSSGILLGMVDSARTVGTVQRWEFSTPAAVVGIRGTEFAIQADRQKGTLLAVFEGRVEMEPAETAEGPQPSVQVLAGSEASSQRGHPLRIFDRFSPGMKILQAERPSLRRRQKEVHDTWSPFTPGVRTELRRKFVAPPHKTRSRRSHPGLTRQSKSDRP